ncbi:uncharacterized protein LOC114882051 [Osmia bicornis bicornis]|uniref:uncharacterized protein LOC114882051 n=1 Tax=Osmia bicornis bicornis TaxID=1437191 RepID=UPI001EAF4FB0|nr:uncharacterized protein LOC114882051 [Osmia bicornis bicornis]
MCHRAHIEAIDRTLRDIKNCDKLMGGTTFVFAGDFRQTLPVIARGTRADIVKVCLKSSPIWRFVQKFNLRTNMGVYLGGGNAQFPSMLLTIGDGTIPNDNGNISIDQRIGNVVDNINDLISKVYPDIEHFLQKSYHCLCERAIITARNISGLEINNIILQKLVGESKEYRSIDTVLNTEDAVHYPLEFLNSLNPEGFPPHNLQLKVGAPIILLRNLNPPNLCNGTRLQDLQQARSPLYLAYL